MTLAHDVLRQLSEPIVASGSAIAANPIGPIVAYDVSNVASSVAYRGAEMRPQWKDWQPAHRSGEAAIDESWDLLTSRIRDLFRNTSEVRSICRNIAKHVVGPGINTFADVQDADGYDERFNVPADDLFERWSVDDADSTGRFSWGLLQFAHFVETMTTGQSFLLECWKANKERSLPLCYQHLESEQLDRTIDRPATKSSNKIVRGIEYDAANEPVAYWFFDEHPHDFMTRSSASSRLPASRVTHTYLPSRPSELSGATWFAANIATSKDLDWYLGNELTSAALGAALVMHVTRQDGGGHGIGPGGTDAEGNATVRLGRPYIAYGKTGDKIDLLESRRPNRDAEPFVKLMMMLQGMAAGVSKLRVTGDYSESSYTSARGAHLDDQAYFVVLQEFCAGAFVRRVRKRFTQLAITLGRLKGYGARDWLRDPWHHARVTVQPPGREQLDPEMETGAAKDRIAAGLSTLQDECGARGLNWRRNVIQRKREIEFCKKQGVELSFDAREPARRGDRTAPPANNQQTKKPAPAPNAA